MLIILLFFQLHGDLRDLHSFPTRRSSDLSAVICWPCSNLRSSATIRGWGSQLSFPASAPAILASGRVQDRKSTRLNSSHEWISYAVFCLKKKKKNNS